ncbi:hypothetical protein U1Q18_015212 [Sarracenia purpurea var. burkii]
MESRSGRGGNERRSGVAQWRRAVRYDTGVRQWARCAEALAVLTGSTQTAGSAVRSQISNRKIVGFE